MMDELLLYIVVAAAVSGCCLYPVTMVFFRAIEPTGRIALGFVFLFALLPLFTGLAWTGVLPKIVPGPFPRYVHNRSAGLRIPERFGESVAVPYAPSTFGGIDEVADTKVVMFGTTPGRSAGNVTTALLSLYLAGVVLAMFIPFARTFGFWRRTTKASAEIAAGRTGVNGADSGYVEHVGGECRSEDAIAEIAGELADELGLRRYPDIRFSGERRAPILVGFPRPAILLPTEASRWREADLRQVLIHELAHFRYRHHVISMIYTVVSAYLFFHPLVIQLRRRLTFECELQADGGVLARMEDPSEYAMLLLRMSSGAGSIPAGTFPIKFARRSSALSGRIEHIISMRGKEMKKRTRVLRNGFAAVVAAVVMCLAGWLASPGVVAEPAFADAGPGESSPAEDVSRDTDEAWTKTVVDFDGPYQRYEYKSGTISFTAMSALSIRVSLPILDLRYQRTDLTAGLDKNECDLIVHPAAGSMIVSRFGRGDIDGSNIVLVVRTAPPEDAPFELSRYAVIFGDPESGIVARFIDEMISSPGRLAGLRFAGFDDNGTVVTQATSADSPVTITSSVVMSTTAVGVYSSETRDPAVSPPRSPYYDRRPVPELRLLDPKREESLLYKVMNRDGSYTVISGPVGYRVSEAGEVANTMLMSGITGTYTTRVRIANYAAAEAFTGAGFTPAGSTEADPPEIFIRRDTTE